jgi:uncharacterized protein YukE
VTNQSYSSTGMDAARSTLQNSATELQSAIAAMRQVEGDLAASHFTGTAANTFRNAIDTWCSDGNKVLNDLNQIAAHMGATSNQVRSAADQTAGIANNAARQMGGFPDL